MESSLLTPAILEFSPAFLTEGISALSTSSESSPMLRTATGASPASIAEDSVPNYSQAIVTPSIGTRKGLLGQYYTDINFDKLQLTRTDPTVNFNFGFSSPGGTIEADRFSVRWTGKIQPEYSETYTFYTRSDDGVRLWVNGQQLINNWTFHNEIEDGGTITLVAGQTYDIKLDYFQNTGSAVSQLSWSSLSQIKGIIPESQLYAPDLTQPTANLLSPNSTITNSSSSPYQFSVIYADNTGVMRSTIDDQDILVSGPNNFSQLAKLVSISSDKDNSSLTATYRIDAPVEGWNANSSGIYAITLQANQISDIDRNVIPNNVLGTFLVDFILPTAKLDTQNPVISGSSSYRFSVTYSDNALVAGGTIGNQDLQVSGPNNFSQLAQLVSFNPARDSSSMTAIYRIDAPNGIWDAKTSVTYTVTLRSNQVSDSSGNYVPRGDLGNFQVNLIPPTAKLIGTNPVTLGSPNYPFTVVYSDDTAVQRSTLDSQDIRVTGPNNSSQFATLISVNSTQDGSPLTATYNITAPGGIWESADTGTYTITLQPNQISDLNGNVIPTSLIGTIAVDLTSPTAKLTAPNISINEQQRTSSFTVVYSDGTAVKRSTIDSQDILVTGPNNATQLATLVSVNSAQDGSPLTATYSITAPGGFWDSADIGAYTITLQANQVSDSSGNFMAAGKLGTFWADQSIYTGDFDGNGKINILLRDLNSQKVSVSLMNGTSLSNQVFLPNMPANYSIVDMADFNGDGKIDLLWRDSANQKVVMWLMDGSTLSSQAFLPDMSANYSVIDTADFNGDGNADLLWRDSVNQRVVVWLMDGTTVMSQSFLRGYG